MRCGDGAVRGLAPRRPHAPGLCAERSLPPRGAAGSPGLGVLPSRHAGGAPGPPREEHHGRRRLGECRRRRRRRQVDQGRRLWQRQDVHTRGGRPACPLPGRPHARNPAAGVRPRRGRRLSAGVRRLRGGAPGRGPRRRPPVVHRRGGRHEHAGAVNSGRRHRAQLRGEGASPFNAVLVSRLEAEREDMLRVPAASGVLVSLTIASVAQARPLRDLGQFGMLVVFFSQGGRHDSRSKS
mmetsp:Transcript_58289/g.155127  ORF Transcript_58289/g.155127 Transcript_58289/m.155127 type:complete len:238 (-) Transcript_58289:19-732(-)